MTEPDIKEQISTAFVQALASDAGKICIFSGKDYGLDGRFKDIDYDAYRRRYSENGFGIDFQVKASINVKAKGGFIIYDLEVKNYLDLINAKVGTPRILILYDMPRDRNEWVSIDTNSIVLKKCAWWCSLKGLPQVNNHSKIRIKIPDNQLLTSAALNCLMDKVKKGVGL